MGLEILDPLTAVAVSLLIIKIGIKIYINAVKHIVDHSADKKVVENLQNIIMKVDEVLCINDLKTRLHGSKLYVDVEIVVDNELSVLQGHNIAEKVHDEIEENFPFVKHCMVHVEPCQKGNCFDY